MNWLSFMPVTVKEIFLNFPTIAKDLVPWKEVAPDLVELSRGLFTDFNQKDFNTKFNNIVATEARWAAKVSPHQESFKEERAHKILTLFFRTLLFHPEPILDLRHKNFEFSAHENLLLWKANKTHLKIDSQFQKGLAKIYHGFYLNQPEMFEEGLLETKLINPDWESNEKLKMRELLYQNFTHGKDGPVRLKMKDLHDSFHIIFDYFVKIKHPLQKDFFVMGLMLITLYEHLEVLDVEVDIRKAYLQSINFKLDSDF